MLRTADGKYVGKDGVSYFPCKVTGKPCHGLHAGNFTVTMMVKVGTKAQPVTLNMPPNFVCLIQGFEAMASLVSEMALEQLAKNKRAELVPGTPTNVKFDWLYVSPPNEEVLTDGRGNKIPKNRPQDPNEGGGREGQSQEVGEGGAGRGTPEGGGGTVPSPEAQPPGSARGAAEGGGGSGAVSPGTHPGAGGQNPPLRLL